MSLDPHGANLRVAVGIGAGVVAGLGLGALLWRGGLKLGSRTVTIEVGEGQTLRAEAELAQQVLSAFYVAPDHIWKHGCQKERVFLASMGRDVTEKLRKALQQDGAVTADNDTLGDPVPGRGKVLLLEVPTGFGNAFTIDTDEDEEGAGEEEADLQAETRNTAALPAAHFVLRPGTDPRLDKAMYVRYDPAPERKTGAIVIVLPGGNYDESGIHGGEGQPVGMWLTEMGITAVVLEYRCVSEGHFWPCQYEDWTACASAVREQAPSWGCDPDRIGTVGFSAGGHLAAYAAVKADPQTRPQLQILVYPAIDTQTPRENGGMEPWHADQGYPAIEDSVHLLVSESTPPAFLVGIVADTFCPADENTTVYAEELEKHGVPYEHVRNEDEDLEHGCGLQDWWTVPCEEWLRKHGWAAPADPVVGA